MNWGGYSEHWNQEDLCEADAHQAADAGRDYCCCEERGAEAGLIGEADLAGILCKKAGMRRRRPLTIEFAASWPWSSSKRSPRSRLPAAARPDRQGVWRLACFFEVGDARMNTTAKKTYVKPTLTKQQALAVITALSGSKDK
jgi:hypothetical protein